MTSPDNGYTSLFVSAQDGLTLHGRDYGPREAAAMPLVCLPGLTRNAADFHALALALARHPQNPRRVLALDFRGRGLSARDPDWRRYEVKVELADTLAFLAAAGIGHAIFLGTSRGGLVTMGIAAARPAMIAGGILNDIGPEVDARGLIRIRSYVGKLAAPRDFDEAVATLKRIMGDQFPAATDEDWHAYAQGTWREENGALALAYDPALAKGLADLDLEAPLPTLWPLFDALATRPLLLLRGAHSDLLSEATAEAMQRRAPAMEFSLVTGQGHAPLLRDATTIARVQRFCEGVDVAKAGRSLGQDNDRGSDKV